MERGRPQSSPPDRVPVLLRLHGDETLFFNLALNFPLPDGELPNARAGKQGLIFCQKTLHLKKMTNCRVLFSKLQPQKII